MEELESEDSTFNEQNTYEKLNRPQHYETIPKLDQQYEKSDDKDSKKTKSTLNKRGIQGNGQDDDAGATTEAEMPGDEMINKHLTKKAILGKHPLDQPNKQGPQEMDIVNDDYLQPIAQQLIPRCKPKATTSVPQYVDITDVPGTEKPAPDPPKNHDYLEMEVYDNTYDSPNEYEVVSSTDGQNQRRLPERMETLPVPVRSPRGPPWERKALIIVLTVLIIVGGSLGVYFSIDRQTESKQVSPTCSDMICQNGGTCRETQGGYSCICVPGDSGHNCEISSQNTTPADVSPQRTTPADVSPVDDVIYKTEACNEENINIHCMSGYGIHLESAKYVDMRHVSSHRPCSSIIDDPTYNRDRYSCPVDIPITDRYYRDVLPPCEGQQQCQFTVRGAQEIYCNNRTSLSDFVRLDYTCRLLPQTTTELMTSQASAADNTHEMTVNFTSVQGTTCTTPIYVPIVTGVCSSLAVIVLIIVLVALFKSKQGRTGDNIPQTMTRDYMNARQPLHND